MSDEPTVPSLSADEEATPVERPKSKSQQKRLAAQRGEPPVAVVVASGKFEDLDPTPLINSAQVVTIPADWPRRYARWRVTEEQEVPSGASSFLLRREQVLSEQQYDIPKLLSLGVKLERLPE